MLCIVLMEAPDPYAHGKFVFDAIDVGLKAVALIIGGLWAVINVQRGRVYKRKLDLDLSGKVFQRNGQLYFSGICRLKNVGQSKYPIEQEGTTCELWAIPSLQPGFRSLHPALVYPFTIFERHGWIEPGEEIEEPLLTPVKFDPAELIGLKADFRVVSDGIEWNTSRFFEIGDNPPPVKDEGHSSAIPKQEGEHDSAN